MASSPGYRISVRERLGLTTEEKPVVYASSTEAATVIGLLTKCY